MLLIRRSQGQAKTDIVNGIRSHVLAQFRLEKRVVAGAIEIRTDWRRTKCLAIPYIVLAW